MQSQRRDPHRGDHIVRQTIIFPFEVLFTTTNSLFCLKMNELLPRFKCLKSLHLQGKGKKFKKGHLGINGGLIRKKEGTRYYVL